MQRWTRRSRTPSATGGQRSRSYELSCTFACREAHHGQGCVSTCLLCCRYRALDKLRTYLLSSSQA
jgi:hypothetical protein